ncbi:MAG TPA: general stress protein [Polyangiales bacterium]|nr:general stress protein [Polyangiales bacterium]
MGKSVLGIVESQLQAESAVNELQERGILVSTISVLFPDTDGTRDFAHEQHTKAPEVALAGVSTGGVIGGTLGVLAGIGALALPGAGAFIAAGPILAALSGAAAGAAIGGIAGALIGLGIPEIVAKRYEGKIRGGNILIAVHVVTAEQQRATEEALKAAGGHDIAVTTEAAVPRNASG